MNIDTVRKAYKAPVRLTFVIGVFLAAVVVLYLIMTTSNPQSAGPLGVTVLIVLMFVAILSTLTLVKMLILRTSKVSLRGLVGLALIPTIVIGLNSLRQLSLVDVVLIVLFASLVNLYIRKALTAPDSN